MPEPLLYESHCHTPLCKHAYGEPDEYAVGHIPGAKLLPLGQVIDRAAEVLPDKNALWLVYCRTGRRSADAVQKLEALGYTHLRDLGGILSWPYEIEGDFEGHF